MNLRNLRKELPPMIGRSKVEKYFPGVVSSGTLANLNSKGLGPKFIKRGRKIFYLRDDILRWLMEEAIPLNTASQRWKEEL